jgi:hypothetical protein
MISKNGYTGTYFSMMFFYYGAFGFETVNTAVNIIRVSLNVGRSFEHVFVVNSLTFGCYGFYEW